MKEGKLHDIPLPTVERVNRYPDDQRLRRHGFTIWSRRGNNSAIWRSKTGDLYSQETALRLIEREQRQQEEK